MKPRKTIHAVTLLLAVLILGVFAVEAMAQSTSAHYVLQQSTINCGGGTSVSPATDSYRSSDSMGQESAIGCSASFNYVLQSGFWSFMGQGIVPVVLTLKKDTANPTWPDLSWSGNNPYYYVYRSTSPSAILSGLLFSQPGQTWTDTAPPAAPVVFYNVLATAPGPIPPPGEAPIVEPASP